MGQPGQKRTPDRELLDRLMVEHRAKSRDAAITHAQQDLEHAILATPTGEARNALTIVNIFLTHAQDLLAGRPTSVSLDDLAQQVADERYDAAMQRVAEFRRIHEESGVIALDEADTEQLHNPS